MDNDVKTKNNEEIAHFLNASDRMIKGIDVLRKKNRPLLNGHRLDIEKASKKNASYCLFSYSVVPSTFGITHK